MQPWDRIIYIKSAQRYYGYIACTRARNQVVSSFSHRRQSGSPIESFGLLKTDLQLALPGAES